MFATDQEYQSILKSMDEVKAEITRTWNNPDQGYNRASLEAAVIALNNTRECRALYLTSTGLKNLRDSRFKMRHKALLSLPTCDRGEEEGKEEAPIYRANLFKAPYFINGIVGAVLAIERLTTHCPLPYDASPQLANLWYLSPSTKQEIEGLKRSIVPKTRDKVLTRIEPKRQHGITSQEAEPQLTGDRPQKLVDLRAGKQADDQKSKDIRSKDKKPRTG